MGEYTGMTKMTNTLKNDNNIILTIFSDAISTEKHHSFTFTNLIDAVAYLTDELKNHEEINAAIIWRGKKNYLIFNKNGSLLYNLT